MPSSDEKALPSLYPSVWNLQGGKFEDLWGNAVNTGTFPLLCSSSVDGEDWS